MLADRPFLVAMLVVVLVAGKLLALMFLAGKINLPREQRIYFAILPFARRRIRLRRDRRGTGRALARQRAVVHPGTVNRQSPERTTEDQVMVTLASQLRTARGANADPGNRFGNLCRDHRALQPTQQ
ncbi:MULTISPECIES: hypothetical protein [unclassified Cupriavidus]|uniref:hypothetical protein n=1 Tax=unclassified Cupriavidus TaxID=2640874 RepID=UPI003F8F070C